MCDEQGLGKPYGSRDRLSTDGKESEMNRSRMKNYMKQFKDDADEKLWDALGIDDQLVNSIRKTYEIAEGETEFQLADWQARLK